MTETRAQTFFDLLERPAAVAAGGAQANAQRFVKIVDDVPASFPGSGHYHGEWLHGTSHRRST